MAVNLQRRIIQFNDLVIDGRFINTQTQRTQFKGTTTPYSGRHGGYYVLKDGAPFVDVGAVEFDFKLPFRSLQCSQIGLYKDFIQAQLAKVGKLWAVDPGGQLLWTNARMMDTTDSYSLTDTGKLALTLTLELYDGVWKKADPTKVYIEDYSVCDFTLLECDHCRPPGGDIPYCMKRCDHSDRLSCTVDCYEAQRCDQCSNGSCCDRAASLQGICDKTAQQLSDMFSDQCATPIRITYSCKEEKSRYGYAAPWGERIKGKFESGLITGIICSNTVLDTTDVTVRLVGCFDNPKVYFNDKVIAISGHYEGIITIESNGDVYYSCSTTDENIRRQLITDKTETCDFPHFLVHRGANSFHVSGGCECKQNDAYVHHDRVTY